MGTTLFFIYVTYEIEKNKRNTFALNARDKLKGKNLKIFRDDDRIVGFEALFYI